MEGFTDPESSDGVRELGAPNTSARPL